MYNFFSKNKQHFKLAIATIYEAQAFQHRPYISKTTPKKVFKHASKVRGSASIKFNQ